MMYLWASYKKKDFFNILKVIVKTSRIPNTASDTNFLKVSEDWFLFSRPP
jgi:hypothetical protein